MRVSTVTVKCRSTGKTMVINEVDWAVGSIPGVNMGGWDRIGETHVAGDDIDAAAKAAMAQRDLVEKQAPKGAAIDAKSKPKPASITTKAKTSKKTVAKSKTAKTKVARKKATK